MALVVDVLVRPDPRYEELLENKVSGSGGLEGTRSSASAPTRDHGRYLGEAVASVLEQDVDGLELLIHDDASADDTAKLVEQLEDPRVHYRRHRRPLGVAENRTRRPPPRRYVAWLDADDSYLPDSSPGVSPCSRSTRRSVSCTATSRCWTTRPAACLACPVRRGRDRAGRDGLP